MEWDGICWENYKQLTGSNFEWKWITNSRTEYLIPKRETEFALHVTLCTGRTNIRSHHPWTFQCKYLDLKWESPIMNSLKSTSPFPPSSKMSITRLEFKIQEWASVREVVSKGELHELWLWLMFDVFRSINYHGVHHYVWPISNHWLPNKWILLELWQWHKLLYWERAWLIQILGIFERLFFCW